MQQSKFRPDLQILQCETISRDSEVALGAGASREVGQKRSESKTTIQRLEREDRQDGAGQKAKAEAVAGSRRELEGSGAVIVIAHRRRWEAPED